MLTEIQRKMIAELTEGTSVEIQVAGGSGKTEKVMDFLVEACAKPDPNPFLFEVGQVVRLKKGLSKDGQTPKFWEGAKVKVVERAASPLFKDHWYDLRHDNGAKDSFKEEEIDMRYARGKKKCD